MEEYQDYLRRIKEQYVGSGRAGGVVCAPQTAKEEQPSRFQMPALDIETTSAAAARGSSPQREKKFDGGSPLPRGGMQPAAQQDRSLLLRLLQQPPKPHDTISSPSTAVNGAGSTRDPKQHTRFHQEILAEVEKLSSTITSMHQERAEMEAAYSQRLRDVRKDMDEKESRAQELELRVEDLTTHSNDIKSQLASAKRDTLRYQRECEMYRQQVLLHTDQQQQLLQLTRDSEEREKLVVAQEQCMRELEVRYESAATTAREYEQRYLRLQQHQQVEVQGQTAKETQWREMLSSVAGALLLLVREVEDTTVRLIHIRGPSSASGSSRGTSPSPSRRSLSFQTDASGEFDDGMNDGGGGAQRSIERALDAMELTIGDAGSDGGGGFRRSKELFSEAIQLHCRRFGKAMSTVATLADEQRSRFSKTSVEISRLEEALGRAEAGAAASARENAQLRRERQELHTTIDRLNRESEEMKGRILELVTEAEKREHTNAQHSESLKQLIEGADLDLHRHRMRVNELEALNTRILSQKSLAEEEHRSTIQQLRQSVALKDSQVARLRSELDQIRYRGADASSLADVSADGEDGMIAHRSISAGQDHQSITGGSVVGTSFLRQQNQQLAAHIEALQRRMERMKEEKDLAIRALEKHRGE